MTQLEIYREQIEHAPQNDVIRMDNQPGNLLGFVDDEELFLCVNCSSRILARGCQLNRTARPVWDSTDYLCALCNGDHQPSSARRHQPCNAP